jgi:CRP/FNR family transcriptional regulator, nitrogen oxide reductase regulator
VSASPSPAPVIDPALLASLDLFRGLSAESLGQLVRLAHPRQYESGSFLFYQEDPAGAMFVLTRGRVRLTQLSTDGQQVILRYILPQEAFAVVAALSGAYYPASAEAVEDSAALAWERDSLERLMQETPPLALNAMRILAGRVQEFQDRLREMATERVERRVARALLRLVRQSGRQIPEGVLIDFPITRQDLAEMTGTTLYTVSRTLSAWEAQGIILGGRERIVVRFPHGLVAVAEDLPERKREA